MSSSSFSSSAVFLRQPFGGFVVVAMILLTILSSSTIIVSSSTLISTTESSSSSSSASSSSTSIEWCNRFCVSVRSDTLQKCLVDDQRQQQSTDSSSVDSASSSLDSCNAFSISSAQHCSRSCPNAFESIVAYILASPATVTVNVDSTSSSSGTTQSTDSTSTDSSTTLNSNGKSTTTSTSTTGFGSSSSSSDNNGSPSPVDPCQQACTEESAAARTICMKRTNYPSGCNGHANAVLRDCARRRCGTEPTRTPTRTPTRSPTPSTTATASATSKKSAGGSTTKKSVTECRSECATFSETIYAACSVTSDDSTESTDALSVQCGDLFSTSFDQCQALCTAGDSVYSAAAVVVAVEYPSPSASVSRSASPSASATVSLTASMTPTMTPVTIVDGDRVNAHASGGGSCVRRCVQLVEGRRGRCVNEVRGLVVASSSSSSGSSSSSTSSSDAVMDLDQANQLCSTRYNASLLICFSGCLADTVSSALVQIDSAAAVATLTSSSSTASTASTTSDNGDRSAILRFQSDLNRIVDQTLAIGTSTPQSAAATVGLRGIVGAGVGSTSSSSSTTATASPLTVDTAPTAPAPTVDCFWGCLASALGGYLQCLPGATNVIARDNCRVRFSMASAPCAQSCSAAI